MSKLIQSKLCFTTNGTLKCITDIDTSKKSNKKTKKNYKNDKIDNKTNEQEKLTKSKPTIAELKKQIVHLEPSNLNQYCAPLPEVSPDYNIRIKLPYLDKLLEETKIKCNKYKVDFAKAEEHYGIFENADSKLLISLFEREIQPTEQYYKRLATEFHLIRRKKFTKVFIQVMEILKIAGEMEIPHIIRGSAGSSLVCYLLKITDIDPIAECISLARFMHTQRDDLPDIDIDFPSNRRDEIYEKIFTIYGNKVARISNHVKYSDKTALKQAIRNTGYNKFIPKDYELSDIVEDATKRAKILEEAETMKGELAHFSLHCGGIIIFDKPIPEEYILKVHEEDNIRMPEVRWQQVSLNKDQVDDYKFIKIDVLSNRGLTELWDIDKRPIDAYPANDLPTLQILSRGQNIGIVYAESRAMRKALICLKPTTIQDIALALAIIRPIAREQKSAYFKDYDDYKKILSDEGKLLDTRKPLHDCIIIKNYVIYDDDAIHCIAHLLGCNESDADIYRKAFAKGKLWKMNEFKFRLSKKHPEYDEEKRQLIYDQLCNLQAYSFCKSHAISYAKLVYALAYCRAHNPIKFWVSALNNCHSSYRKWVHFREAAAVGIKLSRGYAPWLYDIAEGIIKTTNSRKIPITEDDEYDKTSEEIKILEYFRLGYWCSPEFLDGMFLSKDEEKTVKKRRKYDETTGKKYTQEEDVYLWRFKGLISNFRCCKTWKKVIVEGQASGTKERNITFCTIGYENGEYIDLMLYGKMNLSKCHIIEGYGEMMDEGNANWIKVDKWKLCYLTSNIKKDDYDDDYINYNDFDEEEIIEDDNISGDDFENE